MAVRHCLFGLALASACVAQDAKLLWQEPGRIERVDFSQAAGGAAIKPQPPFHFVTEDMGGTSPKVVVRDGAGVQWRVKGGLEVKSESFVTRLVAALGYYAEPTYFVPAGRTEGVTELKRAAGFIAADGSFSNASFELRDPSLKFLPDEHWSWDKNPFAGTQELKGLKVLMMLVSSWDNKDSRDRRLSSNTSVLERSHNGRIEWTYFVNDWGQTLGGWGPELKPKGWVCATFAAQTPLFVQGTDGQHVRFGFSGIHTDDFKNDITVEDVRWLMRYLGRITDAQVRAGLGASGATAAEVACFAKALRERIDQLRRVVSTSTAPASASDR